MRYAIALCLTLSACAAATAPVPAVCELVQINPQSVEADVVTDVALFDGTCGEGNAMRLPPGVWDVVAQVAWDADPFGWRAITLYVDDQPRAASPRDSADGAAVVQVLRARVVSDGRVVLRLTGTQTGHMDLTLCAPQPEPRTFLRATQAR